MASSVDGSGNTRSTVQPEVPKQFEADVNWVLGKCGSQEGALRLAISGKSIGVLGEAIRDAQSQLTGIERRVTEMAVKDDFSGVMALVTEPRNRLRKVIDIATAKLEQLRDMPSDSLEIDESLSQSQRDAGRGDGLQAPKKTGAVVPRMVPPPEADVALTDISALQPPLEKVGDCFKGVLWINGKEFEFESSPKATESEARQQLVKLERETTKALATEFQTKAGFPVDYKKIRLVSDRDLVFCGGFENKWLVQGTWQRYFGAVTDTPRVGKELSAIERNDSQGLSRHNAQVQTGIEEAVAAQPPESREIGPETEKGLRDVLKGDDGKLRPNSFFRWGTRGTGKGKRHFRWFRKSAKSVTKGRQNRLDGIDAIAKALPKSQLSIADKAKVAERLATLLDNDDGLKEQFGGAIAQLKDTLTAIGDEFGTLVGCQEAVEALNAKTEGKAYHNLLLARRGIAPIATSPETVSKYAGVLTDLAQAKIAVGEFADVPTLMGNLPAEIQEALVGWSLPDQTDLAADSPIKMFDALMDAVSITQDTKIAGEAAAMSLGDARAMVEGWKDSVLGADGKIPLTVEARSGAVKVHFGPPTGQDLFQGFQQLGHLVSAASVMVAAQTAALKPPITGDDAKNLMRMITDVHMLQAQLYAMGKEQGYDVEGLMAQFNEENLQANHLAHHDLVTDLVAQFESTNFDDPDRGFAALKETVAPLADLRGVDGQKLPPGEAAFRQQLIPQLSKPLSKYLNATFDNELRGKGFEVQLDILGGFRSGELDPASQSGQIKHFAEALGVQLKFRDQPEAKVAELLAEKVTTRDQGALEKAFFYGQVLGNKKACPVDSLDRIDLFLDFVEVELSQFEGEPQTVYEKRLMDYAIDDLGAKHNFLVQEEVEVLKMEAAHKIFGEQGSHRVPAGVEELRAFIESYLMSPEAPYKAEATDRIVEVWATDTLNKFQRNVSEMPTVAQRLEAVDSEMENFSRVKSAVPFDAAASHIAACQSQLEGYRIGCLTDQLALEFVEGDGTPENALRQLYYREGLERAKEVITKAAALPFGTAEMKTAQLHFLRGIIATELSKSLESDLLAAENIQSFKDIYAESQREIENLPELSELVQEKGRERAKIAYVDRRKVFGVEDLTKKALSPSCEDGDKLNIESLQEGQGAAADMKSLCDLGADLVGEEDCSHAKTALALAQFKFSSTPLAKPDGVDGLSLVFRLNEDGVGNFALVDPITAAATAPTRLERDAAFRALELAKQQSDALPETTVRDLDAKSAMQTAFRECREYYQLGGRENQARGVSLEFDRARLDIASQRSRIGAVNVIGALCRGSNDRKAYTLMKALNKLPGSPEENTLLRQDVRDARASFGAEIPGFIKEKFVDLDAKLATFNAEEKGVVENRYLQELVGKLNDALHPSGMDSLSGDARKNIEKAILALEAAVDGDQLATRPDKIHEAHRELASVKAEFGDAESKVINEAVETLGALLPS